MNVNFPEHWITEGNVLGYQLPNKAAAITRQAVDLISIKTT
ncbi:hypothetical protein [Leptospira alexanderi]|nr:hypothetical protein [Leptospira alexanderi]